MENVTIEETEFLRRTEIQKISFSKKKILDSVPGPKATTPIFPRTKNKRSLDNQSWTIEWYTISITLGLSSVSVTKRGGI